jgi:hypothetical protein
MHETLVQDVLGYVQEYIFNFDKIYIAGWCFHKSLGALPMRINYDNNIIEDGSDVFQLQKRQDVCKVFENSSIEKCGWKMIIDHPDVIEKLTLEVQIEEEWKTVFDFVFYQTTPKYIPSFVVVDNFYKQPDNVRDFALRQQFQEHPDYHKGRRSDMVFRFPNLKERFENILGSKIKNWTQYGVNCCFQSCIAGEQLVYHYDVQQYAGIIFLTPDAPPETGTTFYRSKYTKNMKLNDDYNEIFRTGVLDATQFDVVDVVGNKYNRLVLFDAQMIHAASAYFGNNLHNGRLFQLFFFDLE